MTTQDFMIGNDDLMDIVQRAKPNYGTRRYQQKHSVSNDRNKQLVQLPEKTPQGDSRLLSISGTPHQPTF
ncbi:MAG: hypothetical protein AB8F34_13955 [Akkermansiaceae bacterium]